MDCLGYINTVESLLEPWVESSIRLVDLMEAITNTNATLDIEALLALITTSAKRVMQAEASSLMLLDKTTGELIISVPTGPVKAKLSDFRIPTGKGIAGWVATHGEPLIVPDVSVDPRFYCEADKVSGFKTKAIICVPLRDADGATIGVLEVINRLDNKPFNAQDISLLSEFADQAAIAIKHAKDNARLRLSAGLYEKHIHELKQAEETLVRNDRLMTMGQMAGELCHELNTPIARMRGALYFLKMALTESNEEAKQYLSVLENSVNFAEKLVRDLMDFSKIKSLERQEVRVTELIENALGNLTVPDNVKIESDIPPSLPQIFVDEIQIELVFTNIISNAIDAMPEGGILTIRAESQEQSVHVFFTDTGCGIPAQNLTQIFEPLFTTKKMHGTGFGLTVAKNLTEANDGCIHVESEVEVGTTFTATLPTKGLIYSRDP